MLLKFTCASLGKSQLCFVEHFFSPTLSHLKKWAFKLIQVLLYYNYIY